MQEIWTRIEFWLKANTPQVLDTLNPGASESQIKAVEDATARENSSLQVFRTG